MGKRIGFTGHRPERVRDIYDLNDPVWCTIGEVLAKRLVPHIYKGVDTFYSGLSIGFDMAAACTIRVIKSTLFPHIKLVGIVPFPGQEDLWTPRDQHLYTALIEKCDDLIYVSKQRPKRQIDATRLLLERNTHIVHNSDIIIALWDKMQTGGTWDTIQKAQKINMPIEYLFVQDFL